MSLVASIIPSPDWFVGVSKYELCTENGSWLESAIYNLYPWDAGTDAGITYTVGIIQKNYEILMFVFFRMQIPH